MTLATQNAGWGFWGTMGSEAEAAWPLAFEAIAGATGCDPEAVRAFLDSRFGRHFADDVSNLRFAGRDLATAVTEAAARWQGWRIGRRVQRETGIPAGLPYLTGFVAACGIDLDAAA